MKKENQFSNKNNIEAFVILMLVIVGLYIVISLLIRRDQFYTYEIVDDESIVSWVESSKLENEKLVLKGFAFEEMVSSEQSKIQLILINSYDAEDVLWCDVEQVERQDVNDYFAGSYDYINSGFVADISENDIKLDSGCYEIFIKLTNGRVSDAKTVSTKQFIVNGELMEYNPYEFVAPVVTGILEDVVQKGHMCLYNAESGLYVYLYDNKLYLIGDENFKLNIGINTHYPCFAFTDQIDKLSDDRKSYGSYKVGQIFESYQVSIDGYEYPVAVYSLTDGISIKHIMFGYYDYEAKNYYWNSSFCTGFLFDEWDQQ